MNIEQWVPKDQLRDIRAIVRNGEEGQWFINKLEETINNIPVHESSQLYEVAYLRYFSTVSQWVWYVTGIMEIADNCIIVAGKMFRHYSEFGEFCITEKHLSGILDAAHPNGKFFDAVRLDVHFAPKPLKDVTRQG